MRMPEEKISRLPGNPGVYLFKDERGTIVYIGKAGNIRKRVSSYFQRLSEKDAKTLLMLEKVADIETLVTDTEKEAFILEDNLIKLHHPRYNIKLRDDKNYPCLRLTVKDTYPTLCIVRGIKKDGSLYFGPYPSATSLRETLKLIRRLFPIRTCLDTKFSRRIRPCINYEMDRCLGPCCAKTDPVRYREVVNEVRMFLEGKNFDLVEKLQRKMEEESERLNFEAAARIRDQIGHIEGVIEKQKIVSRDFLDQDVIGLFHQDHSIILYPLFIRRGKLLGGKGFRLPSSGLPDEEVLLSFIHQFYQKDKFVPDEVLVPQKIPEPGVIEEWLKELKGRKVRILVPMRGDRKRLVEMAVENAEKFYVAETRSEEEQEKILEALKEKLHLGRVPRRIEAFDISNLQGGHAVGSMVTFENGQPVKDRYRHYRIRTVEGADDTGMMYEVLMRRYEKGGEVLPDLVLLDGGRGQLNVAREVFKELGIEGIDLLSLAKEKTLTGLPEGGKTEEKIFHPQYREPFSLRRHSSLLNLLDRIRDEAHRFAITFHQKVRERETIQSEIGEIPGVGEARQRALLRHFGSAEKVRQASLGELARAPKMNEQVALAVYSFFREEKR